jgi:uncharacterized protein YdeI (YjbR/CyaY-like superfamily)
VTEFPRVEVTSRDQWRAWLAANHAVERGVWLVLHKKAAGPDHVPYAEAVEEALCYAWVDSKGKALDERRTMLFFTPRRPGSAWSAPNKERIARLAAAGRLAAPGLASVEAARADGSWTALDAVEALAEPPELAAALDADPAARRHWDAFTRSAKRAALDWIRTAKRPETRAARITATVAAAARGQRPR